ncbi:MAG: hypothetical protein AAGD00_05065 [Planctomycetota bacterium]
MRNRLIGLITLATLSAPALGIITTGDGLDLGERTFVGQFRSGTAVAVGERWVITAGHVGYRPGSSVILNGERYDTERAVPVPGADLMLIQTSRNLPGYHGLADGVDRGDRVILKGTGLVAGEGDGSSIDWSGRRASLAGENVIEGFHNGRLAIRFDAGRDALPNEATFAKHDSGSGLFIENTDGTLSLAGIAVGATGRFGQTRVGSLGIAEQISSSDRWLNAFFEAEQVLGIDELSAVPTPGTLGVLALGAGLAARRRR